VERQCSHARELVNHMLRHQGHAAAGPRNEPMIRTLSDCGMRLGEMLALRLAVQDLKTGIFCMKGTAWNGVVIETLREKNHDRQGPIPPSTLVGRELGVLDNALRNRLGAYEAGR
jgi:integrase